MTAFNLHPLSSQKTCLVCGKTFDSYQTFDFLCSDTCKETYFNQGGLPSQNSSILRTTLQTSTGLLTLYALGSLSTSNALSDFSNIFNSKPSIETTVQTPTYRVLPDLLKDGDSPYQKLICLNPPSLEWETQSHQTGFVLKNPPGHLSVKLDDEDDHHLVKDGNLSSLILDQKAPILQEFKTTLSTENQTIQINWAFKDPLQDTLLSFQFENTCGNLVREELTLSHHSGLKQIELSLDGTPIVLEPTQTTYSYSKLTYGTHTLILKAIDQAGNTSIIKNETFELLEPVQIEDTLPIQDGNSDSSNSEKVQTPSNLNNSSSTTPINPNDSTQSTQKPVQDSNTAVPGSSTSNQIPKPEDSSINNFPSSSETKPTYDLPNDTKGSILTRISSRHSSISESDYYQILKGAYDITPTFVLQTIENAGFDIVLTGNNIREIVRAETGWDAGWNYHGVTFPNYQGYKRIWSSLKGGSNILVHEMGHAYDYAVGRPSLSDEFKAIYKAEALKLFPNGGLYTESEGEYYAESFRMYLNERSKVKSQAPQTAAYFKMIFGF